MPKLANKKKSFLEQIVKESSFSGWSDETMRKAAVKCGIDEADAFVIFPGGISEAVNYFAEINNELMVKKLKTKKLEKLRIREKVAVGVMTRLDLHSEHKESMRRLMAYYLLPQNSFQGLRHMAKIVSLIWYEAGDTSTDFNYYTKRGLLAGVFISTFIYWLNDKSKNHEKTEKFLHQRIDNVMQIQKVRAKFEKIIEKLPFVRKML